MKDQKAIMVSTETHKKIKILCAKRGVSIRNFIEHLVRKEGYINEKK